jgi:nicotinamidase-related amidase
MSNELNSKFFLEREDAVLLIIDIQDKLAPAVTDSARVIGQSAALLQGAVLMNLPVMVTEQYPRGLGGTIEQIRQHLPTDAVISEKISFDACTEEIRQALITSGRRQVIIAGMETHVCVYQTVRSLLNEGYEVFLRQTLSVRVVRTIAITQLRACVRWAPSSAILKHCFLTYLRRPEHHSLSRYQRLLNSYVSSCQIG